MLSRSDFRIFQPSKPPRKHEDAVGTHAFAGSGLGEVSVSARESMAPNAVH